MNVALPSAFVQRNKLLKPILVGGVVAGSLDLASAFITFGWGVPQAIASGLLGAASFNGGVATWLLGVVLHFFIAFSGAAVYCLSSWKLTFLREHFFVGGLFYGIAIFLVMNLIVLPLSAVPFKVGPFTVDELIKGLLVHMLIIGLPISLSLWKYSR